jgi:hypothetical protein
MSLLPNATYANPATPLWEVAGGGGGGLNPTFDNVTINQGGAITMGSSITTGTQMFWNKNLAGTTYTQMVMGYDEPAAGALSLTFLDETNDYDRLKVGNVYAFGDGTGYGGAAPQIVLGNASGALGLALKNGTTGTVTPVLSQTSPSVTTFALSNISTINGSPVGGSSILTQQFEYRLPAGTPGGNAGASGVWETRPLNGGIPTLSGGGGSSVISGMSLNLGTYQITVPAGTYLVYGSVGGLMITEQARLYSTTQVLLGTSVGNDSRTAYSTFTGTVTGPDLFDVQFLGFANVGPQDWGQATGYDDEIYAQVQFTKIA